MGSKIETFLVLQERKKEKKVNNEGAPQASEEPLFAIVIYKYSKVIESED